jgi:alpha(1,3/1,4) fucosyltransferase
MPIGARPGRRPWLVNWAPRSRKLFMNAQITFAVGARAFKKNRIFSKEMRDQCNACYIELKESLLESGLALATEDLHPPEMSALVIDVNAHNWKKRSRGGPIRYLITVEPPVICSDNWLPAAHLQYQKVFTWNDTLVDNRKYFLLRYAHNLGVESGLPGFEDRNFAAMIIGFKASSSPQELYSARFETIRWFLRTRPTDFRLYGAGWPNRLRPPASPRVERYLSRPLNFLVSPFFQKNDCYVGPVADKVQTFKNYRFAFCYENTHSVPGYITEKIFDAFRAGCVPVYLGPPNTSDHIPSDCYIDRREFSTHEELYAHLKGISASEFMQYQGRIRSYLGSPMARQFTPSHVAEILRGHILSDLKRISLVGGAAAVPRFAG